VNAKKASTRKDIFMDFAAILRRSFGFTSLVRARYIATVLVGFITAMTEVIAKSANSPSPISLFSSFNHYGAVRG